MMLRHSSRDDMVVAVSANLNLGAEDFADVPGSVFLFKNRITPQEGVARLEQVGRAASQETRILKCY